MVRRIQHQNHETGELSRSGQTFDGFQELRDKKTFNIAPPEAYREAYKITYRRHVEEWTERGHPHKFVYYQLSRRTNKSTEQIGRITTYTTEERLNSLLYRYYNPGHALGLSFHGRVRLSGSAEDPEAEITAEALADGLPSKMPYVTIPADDVLKCDLRVDDEISYTIVNPGGERYTERYHLSTTAKPLDGSTRSLILPLTRIKRLVMFDDGTGRARYIKKADYDRHTEDIQKGRALFIEIPHYKNGKVVNIETVPVHRFINEGDEVAVTISPEEWSYNEFMDRLGRFDFVINTLKLIESKRRAEARWEAERERRGLPPEIYEDLPEDLPEDGE